MKAGKRARGLVWLCFGDISHTRSDNSTVRAGPACARARTTHTTPHTSGYKRVTDLTGLKTLLSALSLRDLLLSFTSSFINPIPYMALWRHDLGEQCHLLTSSQASECLLKRNAICSPSSRPHRESESGTKRRSQCSNVPIHSPTPSYPGSATVNGFSTPPHTSTRAAAYSKKRVREVTWMVFSRLVVPRFLPKPGGLRTLVACTR